MWRKFLEDDANEQDPAEDADVCCVDWRRILRRAVSAVLSRDIPPALR
jgi:hypothetical protein